MVGDAPNIQSLWGDLIIEELVRNGVDRFVVCPGSRSTPLVQAIVRNPRAQATLWIDERGGAFHALGMSRADGWPQAVVTTSGTAVANLLPAVVEASLDGVPLVLLTADRPHELREVGANQSIKQMGIFSDHVRWAFDLPAPDTQMPARALLTTIDDAVHHAVDGHAGPVQLNCPFREPLAPTVEPWDTAWLDPIRAWIDDDEAMLEVPVGDLIEGLYAEGLAERLREAERGVIVCGTLPQEADRLGVGLLADALGWPVWTDIRSQMRLGARLPQRHVHLDRILAAKGAPVPDVVLQFGGRLTSKRMQAVLDRGAAATYILVDPEPSRLDPGHTVTHRVVSDIDAFSGVLEAFLTEAPVTAPALDVRAADSSLEAATRVAVEAGDSLSEPWVARWLSQHMDTDHVLFVSNSMPIRDMQTYAAADGGERTVYTNRGASGIDGIVATAAGCAQGEPSPCTLLIGDVALLHDVNALAMLAALEQPLTIVVLNNGGGGIFSFLPIAEHEDVLRPFIETPHTMRFDGVCASFGVPYVRVDARDTFSVAYSAAIASGTSSVIEVGSDIGGNHAHHERIEASINAALA
jgi:2-succinyl-5-enolpyruvyl-6-hydroxy-3-cyclohexene-1-carboxylate synthase